ncbi:MAG TPA: SUMF1/EgtB/PvdO family nonheme iron enzyme [Opitutaceae bacterium]|nr:SUMF1/EgtB/PvdO family nonheme iron enzyme [Opitutaceae bacterium]
MNRLLSKGSLIGMAAALSVVTRAAEPIVNSVGMTLVPIPAGEFVMGSEQPPANWDERPLHRVTISTPFYIAETEVTAAQFRQFKPDASLTPSYAPYAAGVSWNDAEAYCAWLSAREHRYYRLPTEAEWEYVCRAGRPDGTHWETKIGEANPWGVENLLAGPVEWCGDWYGEYDFAPERDPVGYSGGFMKVVRGGDLDTPQKSHPADYLRPSDRSGAAPSFAPYADGKPNPQGYGLHRIGFRVVLAADPVTPPKPMVVPYARAGVIDTAAEATAGPDPHRPFFRRRRMLPIPPEDTPQAAIDHAGLHPSFRYHNHSPGFVVLPNGDALLVIYTSYREYEPEVSLIGARLRFGADEWDMPSPFIDTPGANDHAPLLWQDGAKTWLFWGNPYAEGHFPFNFITSTDNGATWSPVTFPHITGPLGRSLERPQPINTVIRDHAGTIYLAVDAAGGGPFGSQAMLWATSDGGLSWHDTLGRTAGRHTSFVLRNDGSILGMGGKNSGIDNFMPRSISRDGGRTYTFSKTPFSQLNSGQRPCIIRLASGRLFMAGDYQPSKKTKKPASIKESGSYVALSDDDGETWRIKRLPGAYSLHRKMPSVGYCVARQAPNGIIHLITSLNHPALDFEMNEAWILSDTTFADDDPRMDQSPATSVAHVSEHRENYPDGKPRAVWSSGVADDGEVLLEGKETWYYPTGAIERTAEYHLGRLTGHEVYWSPNGVKQWEWNHHADGTSDWTTYWSDGTKRSESIWKNHELVPGSDKFYPHAEAETKR